MRKHLPIALAGAALLVSATGAVAQPRPGRRGPGAAMCGTSPAS